MISLIKEKLFLEAKTKMSMKLKFVRRDLDLLIICLTLVDFTDFSSV